MRRTWRKVLLLIVALLLPLACVFTESFRTVPSPPTSHAPLAEGTPQPASRGTTDQEGKAILLDSQGSEQAIIQVEDDHSRLPVAGIEVYFVQHGSNYLAVAIDPEGRYLPSWNQGSLEELGSPSSSLTTVRSFFLSSPAYAQPLPLVLLLLKAISKISSLQDLIALLQDAPKLVHWGVLYSDRCWTGEQLANYVGSAGLILPGIDEVAGVLAGGMDEIAAAIFALSQHVIEEDAKELLLGLDRPLRIRTYHLGIPALGMVPVDWCEPEVTPTEPEATSMPTVRPVPPGDTPVAPPTPCGFGWNRPIVVDCLSSDYVVSSICLICPGSPGPIPLTTASGAAYNGSPAWSPDGQWIAFWRGHYYLERHWDDRGEIFIMRPDGSQQTQLTFDGDVSLYDLRPVSWSPDGQWIAFTSEREDDKEIFVISRDGSEQTQLTFNEVDDHNPIWSPDGQWIAYESGGELSIMRRDGSEQTRLSFPGTHPWFFPSYSFDW